MSKFAIVLCTLLFASAVNATMCRFIRRHHQRYKTLQVISTKIPEVNKIKELLQVINTMILEVKKTKELTMKSIQEDDERIQPFIIVVPAEFLRDLEPKIDNMIKYTQMPSWNQRCRKESQEFTGALETFNNRYTNMISCINVTMNANMKSNNNVMKNFDDVDNKLNEIKDEVRDCADNVVDSCIEDAKKRVSSITTDLNSKLEVWRRNKDLFMENIKLNRNECVHHRVAIPVAQMSIAVDVFSKCIFKKLNN